MRQNFRRAQAFFLLIALIGLGWGGASAATAAEAGGSLNLDQAIDLALKEHPAIKQSRETMRPRPVIVSGCPGRRIYPRSIL